MWHSEKAESGSQPLFQSPSPLLSLVPASSRSPLPCPKCTGTPPSNSPPGHPLGQGCTCWLQHSPQGGWVPRKSLHSVWKEVRTVWTKDCRIWIGVFQQWSGGGSWDSRWDVPQLCGVLTQPEEGQAGAPLTWVWEQCCTAWESFYRSPSEGWVGCDPGMRRRPQLGRSRSEDFYQDVGEQKKRGGNRRCQFLTLGY